MERIVVATVGDSITAGSPYWDPDPAVRTRIGEELDPESQWQLWAQRLDPRLDFRNHGVYGERAGEIADRFERALDRVAAVVVQGGINDIAQGRAVEDAARALRAMIRRALARGLGVAIADVLPWNNGFPAAEPHIRQLNDEIRSIADQEGVSVLPFHDTLEDDGRRGRMRQEWTSDGDHPSVAGYRRLGEIAFRLP